MAKKNRDAPEVNAGSMADIAFLLLIFFLVTTTIANDKGIPMVLPPKRDPNDDTEIELQDHNVFTVLVNSRNQLLVEGKYVGIENLRTNAKEFLDNRGADEEMSDSPQKAVVSIKADRGTKYSIYIRVLDELKGAYHELRTEYIAEKIPGFTIDDYLNYNEDKVEPEVKEAYEEAKVEYPLRLSEAEPTNVEGN